MSADWQSWVALAVVTGTALIFVARNWWPKKPGAKCNTCGGGNASASKKR